MRQVFEGLAAGFLLDALVFLVAVPLVHRHLDRLGAPGGSRGRRGAKPVALAFLVLAAISLAAALA